MKAKRKLIGTYTTEITIPRPGHSKRKPKHWGECKFCQYGGPTLDYPCRRCIHIPVVEFDHWTPRKRKGAKRA